MKKSIAKKIVLAQLYSDKAKGLDRLTTSNLRKPDFGYKHQFYRKKDKYILQAIKQIETTRNPGFRYYMRTHLLPDNGYGYREKSALVYFDFKIDGKRYQVSFHSFSWDLFRKLRDNEFLENNKNYVTRWDHKESAEACQLLIDYFDL